MSVIDRVSQGGEEKKTTMTTRQAAATVLVAAITSDGAIAPEERTKLVAQRSSMRLYRQTSAEELQGIVGAATAAAAALDQESRLAT